MAGKIPGTIMSLFIMLERVRITLRMIILFAVIASQARTVTAQAVGSDDPSWSIAPSAGNNWRALAVQSDGKILAANQPSQPAASLA